MMRLLPLLVLVATACTPEPPLPDTDYDAVPELLYFERVGLGQRTQLTDTTEVLIRDAATWAAYQDSLEAPGPFRAVDFEQAMVLLVSVPVETGGYGVEFETAELIDGEVVVTYALVEPAADCLPALAPAQPFEAVFVRRAEGNARFVRKTTTLTCEVD